ncbi:hypothetical protein KTE24_06905 [Burkholderia gladioli]|uniref:hypothetical protein n=1 Tax=Burkholderia gladioli TaxID=28095 RepID=UPI00163EAC36|nr:hypothetical protein [Burkholderia gladioli]MBU9320386.1 hypothetical protein [Burkholderia gladioli]
METILDPNFTAPVTDRRIEAFLTSQREPIVHGPPFRIGIRNDDWDIYRTIVVYGPIELSRVCDFLESLGLNDLLDPGETLDGFNSIYAPD